MYRKCPNCFDRTIKIKGLLFGDCRCPKCDMVVGVQWLARAAFFVVIVSGTTVSTFIVLAQEGYYAALFWITVPIGSLSYLKARFSPLEVKINPADRNGASDV